MKAYLKRHRTSQFFKLPAIYAIVALGVLLPGLAARGDALFTNAPISDAFVTTGPSGNLSSSNYGGAGALVVAAPGLPKGEFQSVMQFNLSSASQSFNTQYGAGLWTVESVTLQLTATPSNNSIFNGTAAGQFYVSLMQNNSWTEGTGTPASPKATGITYTTLQSTYINNATDQALGTFSFNGASSGTASYSLTLSSDLVADLLAGNDASLRLFAADSQVSYLFNSRSGGTSPELIIDVIPEPGTIALEAMGVAAFAIWRRARLYFRAYGASERKES